MIKQMTKMDHQGQSLTLAMMISGIVMSRKAQLSAMSAEIPTEAKEQSIEMRMRRWVKDEIDVEAVYMPFARQILEALAHLPLVLVMDGSQVGQGCMVLMVGVLYQKRALPIAWLGRLHLNYQQRGFSGDSLPSNPPEVVGHGYRLWQFSPV